MRIKANARQIVEEEKRLGAGMTPDEHAILMSFLEARPSYLAAFFDEAKPNTAASKVHRARTAPNARANRHAEIPDRKLDMQKRPGSLTWPLPFFEKVELEAPHLHFGL